MSSIRTSSTPPKTKIFVGRLPEQAQPNDLRRLFEQYGVVTECDILNRFGFVHMKTPEMASRAIEALHNSNFMGSQISVEASTGKKSGRSGGSGGGRGGFGPIRGRGNRGMGRPGPGAPYMRDGYDRRPGPPPPPHGPPPSMRNGYGGGYDNYNRGGYDDYYSNRGPPPPPMGGRDRSMGSGRDDRRPNAGYSDMRGGPGYDRRPYPDRGGYEPRPPPPPPSSGGPPFDRRGDYPPRMPNDGFRRRSPPPMQSGYGGSGSRKEPPSDYGPSRRSQETSESMAERSVDSILKISGSPMPSRSSEKAPSPSLKEHTSDLPSSIEENHFLSAEKKESRSQSPIQMAHSQRTLSPNHFLHKNDGKPSVKCDDGYILSDKVADRKPDPNVDLSVKKNPKKLKEKSIPPEPDIIKKILTSQLPESLKKKSFLRKRELSESENNNTKDKLQINNIVENEIPIKKEQNKSATFPQKKTNNIEFSNEIETQKKGLVQTFQASLNKKRPLIKENIVTPYLTVDKNKKPCKDSSSIDSQFMKSPEIEPQINNKMDQNKYNLIMKWLDKNFGKNNNVGHQNEAIKSWV